MIEGGIFQGEGPGTIEHDRKDNGLGNPSVVDVGASGEQSKHASCIPSATLQASVRHP